MDSNRFSVIRKVIYFSEMDDFFDELPEAIEDPFADETEGENKNPDDEAKEVPEKKPKKKKTGPSVPRTLTEVHLLGQKGINILPKFFPENHVYKSDELENLNHYFHNMERWCHNMYPKWQLDMCLEKIERLGQKKAVQVAMTKLRQGESLFDAVDGKTEDIFDDEQPKSIPKMTPEMLAKIEENKAKALARRTENLRLERLRLEEEERMKSQDEILNDFENNENTAVF